MSNPLPQTAHLMASPDDAEAQFYEALREGNIEKLMAVWGDDDEVVCVHPGGPRIVGPRAIRAAFESMFGQGPVQAHADRVRRLHTVDSAVHSVVERVDVMLEQGPRTAYVMATNVYLRTERGWRLVAHHASPGSPRDLQEVAETPAVLH